MSMQTGVSGLNAASENLNTISNNIANANTVGYKSMNTQFADMYSSETGTGGVYVAAIETNHAQGSLMYTTSATDLAIEGGGFFIMEDTNGQQYYTRAGNFSTDKDGYLVNNHGQQLMGFAVDDNGNPIEGQLVEMQVTTYDLAAQRTSGVDLGVNLDARAEKLDADEFKPDDPNTYHSTTTTTVYDSLGNEQQLTAYYIKTDDDPSTWVVKYEVNGEPLESTPGGGHFSATLEFDENGGLAKSTPSNGGTPGIFDLPPFELDNGAAPLNLTMDVSKFSQYGNDFSVTRNSQDGYQAGSFLGVTISPEGAIVASYSNGESMIQGYVALANFTNVGGLNTAGNTSWTETPQSGNALIGLPGNGTLGGIKNSALENSNVNLSDELVDMIVAQSAYQANTKTISTFNSNTSYLLNTF